MFPKTNRLTTEANFTEVLSRGKTLHSPLFTLKYTTTSQSLESKIGIIASKKIARQAVYRNKARRRIREALRGNVKQLKPGNMLVFLVKREMLLSSYQNIVKEVQATLNKAGLL